MFQVLTIAQVVISVLLIFVVLIQNKNVTLNLTTMSGGMGQVTKRGPEKILHTATIILGILFIINSILLFVMA